MPLNECLPPRPHLPCPYWGPGSWQGHPEPEVPGPTLQDYSGEGTSAASPVFVTHEGNQLSCQRGVGQKEPLPREMLGGRALGLVAGQRSHLQGAEEQRARSNPSGWTQQTTSTH